MKRTLALALCLACVGADRPAKPSNATLDISLPAQVQARPGRLTLIKASTDCKSVKWVCLDDNADLLGYLDNQALFVCTPPEGATLPYAVKVLAYVAPDKDRPSDPAVCTVLVGAAPPGPPNPGPADPLAKALADAYAQDTDAGKASMAAELAAIYQVASASTVNDASLTTFGDLSSKMHAAAVAVGVPDGALPKLRGAVKKYLSDALGADPAAPLTADVRKKAAAAFAKVAQALGGLK